ncbi:hypothetical protein DSO57_1031617 [Entomophthora muscae]|uniref:Uncharacterized protein n=1 Tax=Entomophthora muscae TaxID=34485 RepID=A0ACC2TZ88_9FUNG|nr:hypothetical protein DSO57_1031617 [Entomophthora muscae]
MDPSGLANRGSHMSSIPMTSWPPANRVLHKLPQKQGPPDDERSSALKRESKILSLSPANDKPAIPDTTEDFQTLGNATTRPKGFCKSFPMKAAHCHFHNNPVISYLILALFHLQINFSSSSPSTSQPQETVDRPPELYCPQEHLTAQYISQNIPPILLIQSSPWKKFQPTALKLEPESLDSLDMKAPVPMTPPVTLGPDWLQETVVANELTLTQLLGVLYITLTGLVGSMAPTNGPWALLEKLFSYIVKLAPILWWALPSGPGGCNSVWEPQLAQGLMVGVTLQGPGGGSALQFCHGWMGMDTNRHACLQTMHVEPGTPKFWPAGVPAAVEDL